MDPLTGTVWFARSLSPTPSTSFVLLGQSCKEKAFGIVSFIVSTIIALLVLWNAMFSPEEGIPSECFVFSVAQVYFALGTFNVSRLSLPGHPQPFFPHLSLGDSSNSLWTVYRVSFLLGFAFLPKPALLKGIARQGNDFTWLFPKSTVSHSIRIFYLGNYFKKWHFLKTIPKEE